MSLIGATWNSIVNGIMGGFVNWIIETLFGSVSDSLKKVITEINSTSFPQLNSSSFFTFWRENFALAILISIAALLFSIIGSQINKNELLALNGGLDFLKTIVIGLSLLLVLHLILLGVDAATKGIIAANEYFNSHKAWSSNLTQNITDIPSTGVAEVAAAAFSKLLFLEVSFASQSILLFSVLYMLTFTVYHFKFGHILFRFANAGLIMALTTKLVIVLILVTFGGILSLNANQAGGSALMLIVVLLASSALPLIIFAYFFFSSRMVQIELPTVSSYTRSNGSRGYSVGRSNDRIYTNTEVGNSMDTVASGAEKVAGLAAAAALVVPFGGPILGAAATAAKTTGKAARWKSGNQRNKEAYNQQRRRVRRGE